MIKMKVNKLKGDEVLAKHILSESGMELIAAGTVLKRDYIEKLIDLGIDEVQIDNPKYKHEEEQEDGEFNLIEEVVKKESVETVKNVLEKHIYKNSSDLSELCVVADEIIVNVMSEKEIMTEVTNIRQTKGDIYAHSLNVCALTTVLALKAGFSKEEVSDIAKGSILHDIGLRYIMVPYEDQDISRLPLKEQIEFNKHVIYGYDSIKDVEWLSELSKNIVLLHHERCDGSGYPFKNHGNSISDAIKIVAVCDAFDSLINGIGFKQYKIHEAVEYMKALSVDKLEDTYVDMLLQMVAMYPVGTIVRTNEGEIAEVIKQNKGYIDRPVIKVIKDKDGYELPNYKQITKDMTKVLTIFIVDVLND